MTHVLLLLPCLYSHRQSDVYNYTFKTQLISFAMALFIYFIHSLLQINGGFMLLFISLSALDSLKKTG